MTAVGTSKAHAGDLKVQALLIWGTNEQKPNNPNLKEVDPKLIEKLKKIFKWNHYFEVTNRVSGAIADLKVEKLKLSQKCEVEVKNLSKSKVEVKLWGEGKLVKTVTHSMPPGESLVLAGDDKNDTAWFIVVSPK